jgi:P2-related tail formation protein
MPGLTVQPSINDARSQYLLPLIERLRTIDLTPLLVYDFNSVPDSAILALAWQFDILQPEWQLGGYTLTNEQSDILSGIDDLTDIDSLSSPSSSLGSSDYDSYRALLKIAIPLHATRGTPYAIKTALAALGFVGATLLEGQSTWGGNEYPSNEGWALFRVVINLTPSQNISSDDLTRIYAAANFWKPQRCVLDSVYINLGNESDALNITDSTSSGIVDALDITDAFGANIPMSDTIGAVPTHDAQYSHAGFTYQNIPVGITDGPITVNGVPVEGNK